MAAHITPTEATDYRWRGLLVAGAVIGLWGATQAYALWLHTLGPASVALLAALVFLYTGLFITAHDAMHRTVAPAHPRLNRNVGRLCTLLYALFDYRQLEREHWIHHDHPASPRDPDFAGDGRVGFARWYMGFLWHYVTVRQLALMALAAVALLAGGVPWPNLALFWGVAPILSSLQLFAFGTWLPHRRTAAGYADRHRANASPFGPVLSFFTCYHFGYHWEHHEYPYVPWWRLPLVRRRVLAAA